MKNSRLLSSFPSDCVAIVKLSCETISILWIAARNAFIIVRPDWENHFRKPSGTSGVRRIGMFVRGFTGIKFAMLDLSFRDSRSGGLGISKYARHQSHRQLRCEDGKPKNCWRSETAPAHRAKISRSIVGRLLRLRPHPKNRIHST